MLSSVLLFTALLDILTRFDFIILSLHRTISSCPPRDYLPCNARSSPTQTKRQPSKP